jgi:hypothetical protein
MVIMFNRAATLLTCLLGVVAAVPFSHKLLERQTEPKYPDNGTLTDPPPVTELTRANPTYTKDQINQINQALTAIERFGVISSFGDPNDYFKFDLTPKGSQSNAANGLGGQGYLAEVSNFPILKGTG